MARLVTTDTLSASNPGSGDEPIAPLGEDSLIPDDDTSPVPVKSGPRADGDELPTLLPIGDAEGLDGAHRGELREVKKKIDAYEKITVIVPQNGPNDPQLPDIPVTISDYCYQIKRGVSVAVPRPVYEILVSSGYIQPMFDKDKILSPTLDPIVKRAQKNRFGG